MANNWPKGVVPVCRVIKAVDLETSSGDYEVLIIKPSNDGEGRAVILRACRKTRSMTHATSEYIMQRYRYVSSVEFNEMMKGFI